jgi:tetratricopeptide (TPR) repeat protein
MTDHSEALLTEALRLHQAGRLGEAAALYRRVLAAEPRHAPALHFLGMVALAQGQPAIASSLIAQGIAAGGERPAAYEALGKALEAEGRVAEAVVALHRAVAMAPERSDAWYLLGLAEAREGHGEAAIQALRQAGGQVEGPIPLADLASSLSGVGPARHTPERPLNLIYRISDGGYAKQKLAGKRECLRNCLAAVAPSQGKLTIIADNCGAETVAIIESEAAQAVGPAGFHIHRTALGNGPSWIYARDLALKHDDDEAFYFVEDDYLHRPGAGQVVMEGLGCADYVSLYDHPDKYLPPAEGGNPVVGHGGEVTRLIRTASTHWKFTTSTTMTFAARVGTLRADRDLFDQHTAGRHPFDFRVFVALAGRGRTVITPVPSWSTHGEIGQLAPLVDWAALAG